MLRLSSTWVSAVMVILLVLLTPQRGTAQEVARPSEQAPALLLPALGYLVQADARVMTAVEGVDGFALRTARLRLKGEAGDALRYFIQTEFTRQPVVLDARLTLRLTGPMSLEAGVFKSSFSSELLMFRGNLPLAERARVVRALAPGRQVGANLRVAFAGLDVHVGLFNGNGGRSLANDGNGFLSVARVEGLFKLRRGGTLRLGANGAYSEDDAVLLPGLFEAFAGQRLLGGIDAELAWGPVYVLAEVIGARLEPEMSGNAEVLPWGYALTAGYRFAKRHRVLARLDHFDADLSGDAAHDLLVIGYNLAINPYAQVVADYRFSIEGAGADEFLIRLQFAVR